MHLRRVDGRCSRSRWMRSATGCGPLKLRLMASTSRRKGDWGKSAVLCFELQTGKLLNRIEGPPHTALGDMALTDAGVPIVSDGELGGVYKIEDGRLVLINGKDFISPQTPAVLPGGNFVAVPDYARGIGVLDLKDGSLRWLNQRGRREGRAEWGGWALLFRRCAHLDAERDFAGARGADEARSIAGRMWCRRKLLKGPHRRWAIQRTGW